MTTENTRRTGLIAEKVGMTQIFSEDGEVIPVTLLKANGNIVLENRLDQKDGYNAVVLAYGDIKTNRVSKPRKGLFAKAKVEPKRHIKEFRVSKDALVQAGQEIAVDHFAIDQAVDIQGVNIGKGFAGVMKRHNFRGLEASHGVSVTHRSHGSTGQRQDPGRVFKGKKMAGHMGTETVTVQNVLVKHIDIELGLIAVNGSVPGKPGSIVYISDSIKKILPDNVKLPASLVQSAAPAKAQASEPKEEVQQESEAK